MLRLVVLELGACCYVFHNNDLVHFIENRSSVMNDRQTCLAVSIWGEHCFMYSGERAREIRMAHPTPRGLQDVVRKRVFTHNFADKSCPFAQQLQFAFHDGMKPFLEKVKAGEEATYHYEDLDAVRWALKDEGVPHLTHYGSNTSDIMRITVFCKRKRRVPGRSGTEKRCACITIKPLYKDAEMWQVFCDTFSRITGKEVVYTGGSGTSVMTSALAAVSRHERKGVAQAVSKELQTKQDHKCNICGDGLRPRAFAVDHILPLCEGGEDTPLNLQVICEDCHREKTGFEREGRAPEGPLGFASVLSPSAYKVFETRDVKPKQLQFAMPGADKIKGYERMGFDVNGARSRPILEATTVPVFGPADDFEPLEGYVPGYDFYVVGNKPVPQRELVKLFEAEVFTPDQVRAGCKASRHVSAQILHRFRDQINRTFKQIQETQPELWERFSFPTPESATKVAFLRLIGAWNANLPRENWVQVASPDPDDCPGPVESVRTLTPQEAEKWGCNTIFSTRVQQFTNVSFKPLGLIALWGEQAEVLWLLKRLERCSFIRVLGVNIDCCIFTKQLPAAHIVDGRRNKKRRRGDELLTITPKKAKKPVVLKDQRLLTSMFKTTSFRQSAEQELVDATKDVLERTYPGGNPVYKMLKYNEDTDRSVWLPKNVLTEKSASTYTYAPKSLTRSREPIVIEPGNDIFTPRVWSKRQPRNALEIAENALKYDGVLLTGLAGTGKSTTFMDVARVIESTGDRVIKTAFTHVAANNVAGNKTLLMLLGSYKGGRIKNAEKTWIFLDEGSQVQLSYWAALARLKMIGVRFAVAGDWYQQLPIHEPYGQAAAIRMEWGSLLHELCGGLRYELMVCRRSDLKHFEYYSSLRFLADARLCSNALQDLKERYPWTPQEQEPDVCLCMSHETRLKSAKILNERAAARAEAAGLKVVCYKADRSNTGGATHPEMKLWTGLELTGNVKDSRPGGIENGCEYEVVTVEEDKLEVKMVGFENATVISLTPTEALKMLRLSCARTYAGCQGQTLRDLQVLLLDVDSPHFDRRKCYVAVSRVTAGSLLHTATVEQQKRWLCAPLRQ